jgi:hypothetical protein
MSEPMCAIRSATAVVVSWAGERALVDGAVTLDLASSLRHLPGKDIALLLPGDAPAALVRQLFEEAHEAGVRSVWVVTGEPVRWSRPLLGEALRTRLHALEVKIEASEREVAWPEDDSDFQATVDAWLTGRRPAVVKLGTPKRPDG